MQRVSLVGVEDGESVVVGEDEGLPDWVRAVGCVWPGTGGDGRDEFPGVSDGKISILFESFVGCMLTLCPS